MQNIYWFALVNGVNNAPFGQCAAGCVFFKVFAQATTAICNFAVRAKQLEGWLYEQEIAQEDKLIFHIYWLLPMPPGWTKPEFWFNLFDRYL